MSTHDENGNTRNRDLMRLGEQVVSLTDWLRHSGPHGRDEPYYKALGAALERLMELGDADGLAAVIDQLVRALAEERDLWARERAQQEQEHAEAVRRHGLAVTVDCPWCGAPAGATCHTTGATPYSLGVHDHADRYRKAAGVLTQGPNGARQ